MLPSWPCALLILLFVSENLSSADQQVRFNSAHRKGRTSLAEGQQPRMLTLSWADAEPTLWIGVPGHMQLRKGSNQHLLTLCFCA